MPRRSALLLSLVLVASACSPADPKALTDQGHSALGAGDAEKAQASFDDALAQIDPSHPEWLRASLGRCQALARHDPTAAREAFLGLARSHPARVTVQDFSIVVGELVQAGAVSEAIDVMDAGIKLYPESPVMQVIKEKVIAASTRSQDPGVSDKLKGLGYVGQD